MATGSVKRATINNLTTSKSGQGALDAYQGKVLNDKISSCLMIKSYSATFNNSNSTKLTAEDVSGYSFVCWVNFLPAGNFGWFALETPSTSKQIAINRGPNQSSVTGVTGYALYLKS